MKVKLPLILSCFFLSVFSWVACGDQKDCCLPPPSDQDYSKGIFVVNEGPFGGTGTISWYNPDTGEVRDSIYEKSNNGANLGQFVQSLTFYNGKGYIVVNGANRVVVVNAATFEYLDTIGTLQQPRYFLPVSPNAAYVSQWGADGLTGSVAKVNLNTLEVEKNIPTGKGPEKMVLANNKVYVANSGGYGLDSSITEIKIADDLAQTSTVPAGKNPASLLWYEKGQNSKLFYLCKGYFLDTNPEGRLNYLSNNGFGIATPAFADDLVFDPATELTYFYGQNQVYKMAQNGSDFSFEYLFGGSIYTLALDADSGLFYCGDAKDFTSNGEIFVRRLDGSNLTQFRAGVAPGEIVIVH